VIKETLVLRARQAQRVQLVFKDQQVLQELVVKLVFKVQPELKVFKVQPVRKAQLVQPDQMVFKAQPVQPVRQVPHQT
jgi:hypothetical protein